MQSLGVAVVGFGWMGRVHAQAYARVRHHFPEAPAVHFVAVADDVPGRADKAAEQFGFAATTLDWRTLVDDPQIGAVSITVPNFLHREVGAAFAKAGKHIYLGALLRMNSGARVVLEASRVAVGEQNGYGFEIHGTRGALFWDFRRLGELGVASGSSYQDESVRTVFVGPGAGDYAAFQPGAANAMGYDDLKVIEAHRFLRSIADGTPRGATLADAVRAAEALDAMSRSAETGGWVRLPE